MARGWRGDPPVDDDEARARIIAAAMRCIVRLGPEKTGLSSVATELGITRQTVYRLYASTDDLLRAVAVAAADTFLDRLAVHTAGLTDPADALIEAMVFTYQQLPDERFLGVLLAAGRSNVFAKGVTSDLAMTFGSAILARMAVDWPAYGYDEAELEGLAQFALRILQSLVIDPPASTDPDDLRTFLRRWIAPAISLPVDRRPS